MKEQMRRETCGLETNNRKSCCWSQYLTEFLVGLEISLSCQTDTVTVASTMSGFKFLAS